MLHALNVPKKLQELRRKVVKLRLWSKLNYLQRHRR